MQREEHEEEDQTTTTPTTTMGKLLLILGLFGGSQVTGLRVAAPQQANLELPKSEFAGLGVELAKLGTALERHLEPGPAADADLVQARAGQAAETARGDLTSCGVGAVPASVWGATPVDGACSTSQLALANLADGYASLRTLTGIEVTACGQAQSRSSSAASMSRTCSGGPNGQAVCVDKPEPRYAEFESYYGECKTIYGKGTVDGRGGPPFITYSFADIGTEADTDWGYIEYAFGPANPGVAAYPYPVGKIWTSVWGAKKAPGIQEHEGAYIESGGAKKLYWQILWEWNGKKPIKAGGRGEAPEVCQEPNLGLVDVKPGGESDPEFRKFGWRALTKMNFERYDVLKEYLEALPVAELKAALTYYKGETVAYTAVINYQARYQIGRVFNYKDDLTPGQNIDRRMFGCFAGDPGTDAGDMGGIFREWDLKRLVSDPHLATSPAGGVMTPEKHMGGGRAINCRSVCSEDHVLARHPLVAPSGWDGTVPNPMGAAYDADWKPYHTLIAELKALGTAAGDQAAADFRCNWPTCEVWTTPDSDANPAVSAPGEWYEWSVRGEQQLQRPSAQNRQELGGCNSKTCHNFRYQQGDARPDGLKVGDLKGCCCSRCQSKDNPDMLASYNPCIGDDLRAAGYETAKCPGADAVACMVPPERATDPAAWQSWYTYGYPSEAMRLNPTFIKNCTEDWPLDLYQETVDEWRARTGYAGNVTYMGKDPSLRAYEMHLEKAVYNAAANDYCTPTLRKCLETAEATGCECALVSGGVETTSSVWVERFDENGVDQGGYETIYNCAEEDYVLAHPKAFGDVFAMCGACTPSNIDPEYAEPTEQGDAKCHAGSSKFILAISNSDGTGGGGGTFAAFGGAGIKWAKDSGVLGFFVQTLQVVVDFAKQIRAAIPENLTAVRGYMDQFISYFTRTLDGATRTLKQ